MRRTFRQLAAVKPSRYLEAGTPTGLTGLFTHPSPRASLLFLYSRTLEKLEAFPSSSLYRQSIEALTKHRLSIVEKEVPEGYNAWWEKTKKVIADHPEAFTTPEPGKPVDEEKYVKRTVLGKEFVFPKAAEEYDPESTEWDDEESRPQLGWAESSKVSSQPPENSVEIDPEPILDAVQIEKIENQIGAGLIEEVIRVAEGELKLVDIMLQAKVFEDLEDKPTEGQWTYFGRKA